MAIETPQPIRDARRDNPSGPPAESATVAREQRVASMRERAARAADDLVSHGWKEADRIAASFESPVDDEARKGLAAIEAQIRAEESALEEVVARESLSPEGKDVARGLDEILARAESRLFLSGDAAGASDAAFREELADKMDGIIDVLLANEAEGFAILRGQTGTFVPRDGHPTALSAMLLDRMTSRNDYHADPETKKKIRSFIRRYAESLVPGDRQFSDVRGVADRIAARERVALEKTKASEAARMLSAGDAIGAIELLEEIGESDLRSVGARVEADIREGIRDLFGSEKFSRRLQAATPDQQARTYRFFARWFKARMDDVIRHYPEAVEVVGKEKLYELATNDSAIKALRMFPDIGDVLPREKLYALAVDQGGACALAAAYPDAFSVLGKERMFRAIFTAYPIEILNRYPEAIPSLGETTVYGRLAEIDPFGTVEQFPEAWKFLSKAVVFRRMLELDATKAVRLFPSIFDELPKAEIYATLLANNLQLIESYPDIPDVLGLDVVLRTVLGSGHFEDEVHSAISALVRSKGLDAVFGSHEMRSAAPSYLVRARGAFHFQDRDVPWADALIALDRAYPITNFHDDNRWRLSVDPLAKAACELGVLSVDRAEDGAALVEFVREFGPGNEMALFETFVALKRARSMTEVPGHVLRNLSELLGENRVKSFRSPDAALSAISQWKRELTGTLLRDEVPAGVRSPIGEGIFRGVKGGSNWGRMNDESEVIGMWERTVAKRPEDGKLPEGYAESTMAVRRRTQEKSVDFDRVEQEVLDNPNVRAALRRPYLESFSAGTRTRSYIVDVGRREVVREWHDQIQRMEDAVSRLSGRALEGAQKNLFRLRDRLDVFLRLPDGHVFADAANDTEASVVRLMEELSAVREKSPAVDAYLRALSFSHILDRAPTAVATAIQELAGRGEVGDAIDGSMIHEVREFLTGYLSEHYLNDNPADHETGHEPFSPGLRKALAGAWQVTGDLRAHPIVQASDRMRMAETGGSTTRTTNVSLVPAQGLLRTFAGDVGQVCYSSKHELLAKGGVPDLHAMIFVTGRGTDQERLAGSVLFIETETPDGKRALVIRANNPLEDLFKKVDGADLVRATIDAAIETARRRGLDLVVAPLDDGSGTHRRDVLDYYQEHFSYRPRVELVTEPETTFNGFDNANPDGYYPVVEVWKRETE